MRLAVVSPFVDRRHGTERALAELVERLARDYACDIYLYAQRVEDVLVSAPHGPRSGAQAGTILWHKVPSIPGPHVVQFLVWMFLNGFLRRWHTTFRRVSYDLVLSPGINCLHPDAVIVHALFHRLHELAEKKDRTAGASLLRRAHRRIYYGLLTRLERKIYRDPRVSLAAVSQRMAGMLKNYFGREDVCVVPNAVDTGHFSPTARLTRRPGARKARGFRDDDFVLLLVGNDWGVKGLPTVLKAMGALPGLPLQLLVVGDDSVDQFRGAAKCLGVDKQCHWELPRAEALDFYSAADAYVSPSLEDSFGLPVAEAMACGLPAITSVYAGVADRVQNAVDGFVLEEPRDAHFLADLLRRLHADEEMRRRIGEAAAQKALEWSWDESAAALWTFLKKRAAAGGSRG